MNIKKFVDRILEEEGKYPDIPLFLEDSKVTYIIFDRDWVPYTDCRVRGDTFAIYYKKPDSDSLFTLIFPARPDEDTEMSNNVTEKKENE